MKAKQICFCKKNFESRTLSGFSIFFYADKYYKYYYEDHNSADKYPSIWVIYNENGELNKQGYRFYEDRYNTANNDFNNFCEYFEKGRLMKLKELNKYIEKLNENECKG